VSARLARSIYQTICDNPAAIASVKAEAGALALSLATDPDASFELTSSTVNGQTFSGRRTMSNGDRLTMLRLILKQVDAGRPMNLDTRAVF